MFSSKQHAGSNCGVSAPSRRQVREAHCSGSSRIRLTRSAAALTTTSVVTALPQRWLRGHLQRRGRADAHALGRRLAEVGRDVGQQVEQLGNALGLHGDQLAQQFRRLLQGSAIIILLCACRNRLSGLWAQPAGS